jgi:hypothetical protein
MAFGQLNKWFEQCDIPQVQKRFYSDDDNQSNKEILTKKQIITIYISLNLVSVKRQCTESVNIKEE